MNKWGVIGATLLTLAMYGTLCLVVYGVATDCPNTAIYVRCNGVTL